MLPFTDVYWIRNQYIGPSISIKLKIKDFAYYFIITSVNTEYIFVIYFSIVNWLIKYE